MESSTVASREPPHSFRLLGEALAAGRDLKARHGCASIAELMICALASSLCVMLPVSIFTLFAGTDYAGAASGALSLFPAAAAGGLFGAFLSDRLRGGSVKYIFAVLTGIAGLNMLFGR